MEEDEKPCQIHIQISSTDRPTPQKELAIKILQIAIQRFHPGLVPSQP